MPRPITPKEHADALAIIREAEQMGMRVTQLAEGMSKTVAMKRDEAGATTYWQTYTKGAAATLPGLTRAIVNKAMLDMERDGYVFERKPTGTAEQYSLTIQNIIDIYHHRKEPKFRDRNDDAFVIMIGNLKGGVAKTASTVTLAHAMRVHRQLLKEDLRILVIDLDPQSSATMFLRHEISTTWTYEESAVQAMLQNASRDELLSDFIKTTIIPGVDLIAANIEDGFVASNWSELCEQALPGIHPYQVLEETIINKVRKDYDIIFVDTGPHLDALLMNGLQCAKLMLIPIPPAQVDFESTCKFQARLPGLLKQIVTSGAPLRMRQIGGFMSKFQESKGDHKEALSAQRRVLQADLLDIHFPRLEGFERCGESYDTVISANPKTYPGSPETLRAARTKAEDFALCVFDRIEMVRAKEGRTP